MFHIIFQFLLKNSSFQQGCGSVSGLDPDSMTWVDLDSESGSGSMGKENKERNALFLNFLTF
jgi:hypothetical protein